MAHTQDVSAIRDHHFEISGEKRKLRYERFKTNYFIFHVAARGIDGLRRVLGADVTPGDLRRVRYKVESYDVPRHLVDAYAASEIDFLTALRRLEPHRRERSWSRLWRRVKSNLRQPCSSAACMLEAS